MRIAKELELPNDAITQTFAQIGRKGSGKALALDTPIPTPDGWTTMGEVKEGDKIFDEEGNVCNVTYIAPIQKGNQCYEITFSDKTSIIADAEHLWLTENYASRKSDAGQKAKPRVKNPRGKLGTQPQCQRKNFPSLVTTEEISKSLIASSDSARNHAIQNTKPLQCPKIKLLIDPYVLGIWLGDGTSTCGCITVGDSDKEIVENLSKYYKIWEVKSQRKEGAKCGVYRLGKLNPQLRKLNLLGNKHIPKIYLRSSIEQRLSLLKGLMDSDGYCDKKRNICEFTNCNIKIANGVEELIVSLGWKVFRSKKQPRIKGNPDAKCKISHRLNFRPLKQVFRISRKKNKLKFDLSQKQRHSRRYIISVEEVDSVLVRCIAVDSESHLFLAGKQMIPTHNTYLASMIAEQMIDLKAQVIVIDPIGNWWGLRVDADGKSKGKDIFVIGGTHGDVPLSHEAGKEIARILTEKNISVVLDISEFRKNERKKFVTDFAEEFYHLKKTRLSAVHIFLEESQKFVPQMVQKDDARMLGAWEDIVRLGRNYGIGCSLISQRPQSINKEVLSQVECLCVLQITGLHERKALESWVQEAGESREIIGELPGLRRGEGYVWSPAWLRIFKRVNFNKKTTLDTSATPELGKASEIAKISKIDIKKLQEQMSEVMEKAQKELKDIKDYKNEIVRLKSELSKRPKEQIIKEIKVVDERAIERGRNQSFKEAEIQFKNQLREIEKDYRVLEKKIIDIGKIVGTNIEQKSLVPKGNLYTSSEVKKIRENQKVTQVTPQSNQRVTNRIQKDYDSDTNLDKCARKIYSFLFTNPNKEFTKKQVAFMTGYRISGSFNNSIYSLTSKRLIVKNGDMLFLGEIDSSIATEPNEEFSKDIFSNKLNKCEKTIFEVLWENPERDFSKEELVELSGYSYSGSFNNAIYKLKALNFSIRVGSNYKLNPEILEL